MKRLTPTNLMYVIIVTAGLCGISFASNYKIPAVAFSVALLGEIWLWLDSLNDRMQQTVSALEQIPAKAQRRHGLKLIKGGK